MYERKTTDVYDIMVKEGRGQPRHVYKTYRSVAAAEAAKKHIAKCHSEWDIRVVKKRIKCGEPWKVRE